MIRPEPMPVWLTMFVGVLSVLGVAALVFGIAMLMAYEPPRPEPVVPYSGLVITQCDFPIAAIVIYSNGGYEVSRPTDSHADVSAFFEAFELVPKERRTEQKMVSVVPCSESF